MGTGDPVQDLALGERCDLTPALHAVLFPHFGEKEPEIMVNLRHRGHG